MIARKLLETRVAHPRLAAVRQECMGAEAPDDLTSHDASSFSTHHPAPVPMGVPGPDAWPENSRSCPKGSGARNRGRCRRGGVPGPRLPIRRPSWRILDRGKQRVPPARRTASLHRSARPTRRPVQKAYPRRSSSLAIERLTPDVVILRPRRRGRSSDPAPPLPGR